MSSDSEEPRELEQALGLGEVDGSMIDDGGTDNPAPNAAFLLELNLVLMVSFLSLSAEECLNTGEAATPATKNKAKVSSSSSSSRDQDHPSRMASSIPRFQTRRREASDFRLIANRDCRHGRRM